MFALKIIFLFYQFSIGYSFEYTNFIPELVKDLIFVDQTPSMVITTNSWDLKIISEIQKKYSIPIKFSFVGEMEIRKYHTTFLADLNTSNGIRFVKSVDKLYFRHPYRWIIINKVNETDDDVITIEELAVLPDSNVVIVDFIGDGNCILQQIYKIELTWTNIYENYGFWNKTNGLTDLRSTNVLSRRRKNLKGKVLTASIVLTNNDTINHLTDYHNTYIDPITKSNYICVNDLMNSLNVSKKFIFTSTWGYFNKTTNRWSGMLRDIVENKADIGGTSIFMTGDRVEVIEYLLVITETFAKFVFKSPPLSYVSNIYFLPFQKNVWFGAGILILLITISIYFFLKFENVRNTESDEIKSNNITDVILIAIAGICQMGTHIDAKYISARISLVFIIF